MATPRPTAKKANANTEIVLGQAAQQITKAVNELNNATSTVNQLASRAEELTLQVANKEEAIQSLTIEYGERERQLNVNMELSFKANTNKVVNEHLASINSVSIPSSELNQLRSDLSEARSNTEAQVKREVTEIATKLKTQYENEIKLIHSENKAIAAENAAKMGSLSSQNTFLEGQVVKLYAQLDAERNAGIERAKAGSVGSINVSGPQK
jgi:hypothetical protein